MNREFDHCIYELVEYEEGRCDRRFDLASLSQLRKPSFKNQVKDSAEVFKIKETGEDKSFIITLSNQSFPDSVSDAVARANAILATLDFRLAKHILSPFITGDCNQRSYAFWPARVPISSNKILRKAQITSINSGVIQWISDIGRSTQIAIESKEEIQSRYYKPLAFLLDENDMPSMIKQVAEDTLASLEASDFRPVCVAQHGDFWHGNILLDRFWPLSLRSSPSFYVIDWGGSTTLGYPFIDPLRYLMSTTGQDSKILRYLVRYHEVSGLSFQDIVRYACTYSGYLGINRGEFPLERYYTAVSTLIQKASTLLKDFQGQQ